MSDTPTVKPDFPGWLKQQIKLREMTQAQFAERGGITPSQVSHVLNRLRNPGEDFFKATALALRMPVVDIYKIAGVIPPENGTGRYPYTNEEMRLIHLFRELGPGQRGQVVEFAEFLRSRGKGE
jgi:transcriptional regulator with XRE-family HTH domain